MTPEGNVKKRVKELLHKYDILPFKECLIRANKNEPTHGYYSMPSSTGYGEAGIGDFLCCMSGYYFEIETKTPNGKLRGVQAAHGRAITNSSGGYFVIRAEEDMRRLQVILNQSLNLFTDDSEKNYKGLS